ncbi:MAG TPA: DNA-binding protein [Candidatus Saccharimonadales bacterium]|jgi:DNA-binding TFAR19-related protein (PDSD5 family)|nr:DNA-binding protein [Candidatus Saccharimonadales bacterium]
MSDDAELEKIKRQRLAEMQKNIAKKQEIKPKTFEPEEILRKIFVGRAWEVYAAARRQYPTIANQIFRELALLVQSGRIRDQITGEQLFGLLRQIGLDVRLDTKIQVLERGELKSIADKFRGS